MIYLILLAIVLLFVIGRSIPEMMDSLIDRMNGRGPGGPKAA